jgi:16S rRNA (guanine(966)-N(2))-methyltransferase RsmD
MTKKHTIRIVGGEYRRTPIPVIEGTGLRPTPDRVRETLYNWLQHLWGGNITDKNVLDLFAGSGALGFEAASRGAAHVQMVENNHEAVLALRALRTKLGANNVRIHEGDALAAISHLNAAPFDLVLLDPPFGQGWLDKLWTPLVRVLNPARGLIYVESESHVTPLTGFETIREGKAGNVHFHLIQFAALQKIDNNLPIPK